MFEISNICKTLGQALVKWSLNAKPKKVLSVYVSLFKEVYLLLEVLE